MSLVTRAVIKSDWLNIAAIDTSKDALIDRLIAYVDSEILDICAQPLEATSIVRNYEGTRDELIYTGYTVPATLTSLKYRQSYGDSFAPITGNASIITKLSGLAYIYADEPLTALQYEATMTVGFTTLPAVITSCAAEMVTELYLTTPFAMQTNRFGVTAITESEGGVSMSKALASMRTRASKRLAPYIRITI